MAPHWTRRRFLQAAGLAAATAATPRGLLAATGAVEPFTFVQITDTQLGFGGYDHDVGTAKRAIDEINDLKPDFVLHCGDFVHDDRSEKAWNEIAAILKGLKVPWHGVRGNRDAADLFAKHVGKPYYAFRHKGCTFVALDTNEWWHKGAAEKNPARPAAPSPQEAWLGQTLRTAARQPGPIFVFGHIALYTKDPAEPPAYMNLPPPTRPALLALFRSSHIAAYLTGHYHGNNVLACGGIQLVTTASTSKNSDGSPLGFRVWTVGPKPPPTHKYVALKGREPGKK